MTEEKSTTTCGCVWGDHPEANMNCRYPALLKAAEAVDASGTEWFMGRISDDGTYSLATAIMRLRREVQRAKE